MDNAIDLLFEIREALEETATHAPNATTACALSVDLVYRLVKHTEEYAASSRLRSNGNAHRDRLVAARLNLRES